MVYQNQVNYHYFKKQYKKQLKCDIIKIGEHMKKLIIGLLLVIGIININYVFAKNNEFTLADTIYGDVDSSGKVDSADYILIRKVILQTINKTDNADVNSDGEVNSMDYIIVRKIILGVYEEPSSTPTPIPTNNTSSDKKDDTITITLKTATYTGKGITPDVKSESGNVVSLTYYSDASCKTKTTTDNAISAGGAPKKVGTYYVIGTTEGDSNYNATKSTCIEAVKINHIEIKLNKTVTSVKEGGTVSLSTTPSSAKVTYSSNNTHVATVNSSGVVTGKNAGSVKIIAKSSSGYQAETSVIVLAKSPYKDPITYSSSSLKYWIQFYNVYAGDGRYKRYAFTNIWMEDAYNQMIVAHPLKYITPENIMKKEISTYGLSKKGILAMNASPSSDNGYPSIPLVIDTGKDGKTKVLKNTGKSSKYTIYGLGSDGILRTYKSNSSTKDKALSDGVKYTFGFKPVIIKDSKYDSDSVAKAASEDLPDLPDVRSAVCQVDKNNFILITSWSFSIETENRRKYGLKLSELGDMMLKQKCITGVNLDGGSSLTYMFKKSDNNFTYLRKSAKPGRSDVLYFREK